MASATPDYVEIAINYAQNAVKDKKGERFCLLIRRAGERFLNDLERSQLDSCDFYFDDWYANDACDFISKLPHVEGKWTTPTIELHNSHVFFLVQLFGFRKIEPIIINDDDGPWEFHPRRYTSALFAVARKNAKSTLAAGIMIYCQCCEPEDGAQLITAATTYDQASIIFKIAKAMIQKTSDLREEFGVETWAKAITREEVNSTFKALHAKASTQDGLNPSHTALDEIHAHKTSDLLNVLTSAAGARANPLWLYTTTEGYINPGPWGDLRHFAKQILMGRFGNDADHFLVSFYGLDSEDKTLGIKADSEFDETKWIKANPLLDVNPYLMEAIRKESVEAKQMPSKLAEFRIKRCNRQSATGDGWIDILKWDQCAGHVPIKKLKTVPCWGGLDLASTRDFTSMRLVWKLDDILYTIGWRFVPEAAVAQRTERNTVPYQSWVEEGLLIQTEGDVTDYQVIEDKILKVNEFFNVQQWGYDRWNATDLVNRLVAQDVPMIEFVQGPKSYHPAMQALERAYIPGKLRHGGDKVLNWCASNLVARYDNNRNMAPDKKNSADKIDDMTALLMPIGLCVTEEPEKEKEYQLIIV